MEQPKASRLERLAQARQRPRGRCGVLNYSFSLDALPILPTKPARRPQAAQGIKARPTDRPQLTTTTAPPPGPVQEPPEAGPDARLAVAPHAGSGHAALRRSHASPAPAPPPGEAQ